MFHHTDNLLNCLIITGEVSRESIWQPVAHCYVHIHFIVHPNKPILKLDLIWWNGLCSFIQQEGQGLSKVTIVIYSL